MEGIVEYLEPHQRPRSYRGAEQAGVQLPVDIAPVPDETSPSVDGKRSEARPLRWVEGRMLPRQTQHIVYAFDLLGSGTTRYGKYVLSFFEV